MGLGGREPCERLHMHPARPRCNQQGAQEPTLISGHCPPSSSVFSSLMSRLVTPCAWESSRGTVEVRGEDAPSGAKVSRVLLARGRSAKQRILHCATAAQQLHASLTMRWQ